MFHQEAKDMFEHVESSRHDPKWQVRVMVARILPVVAEAESRDYIRECTRELLLDAHKQVQIAILESCAEKPLRTSIPVEWIIACISDTEWSIRAAAVWCIGFYGKEAPAKRLIEIAGDREEHSEVRASALYALSTIDAQAHLKLFLNYLNDEVWQVREAALLALADRAEQYSEHFLRAVHDESIFVRVAAVQGIGKLNARVALPILLSMLNDDVLVIQAAIEAINAFGQRAIAEVVGVATFLPANAPLHTILQEEDALVYKGDDILQRLYAFIATCRGLSVSLNLSDSIPSPYTIEEVLAYRETSLWNKYVDALAELLFLSCEIKRQLPKVYHLCVSLLKHLDGQRQRTQRHFQSTTSWLLPELVFRIGDAALHLSWQLPGKGHTDDLLQPTIRTRNEYKLEEVQGERTPVSVSLHLQSAQGTSQPQNVAIIKLLRSYTTTPLKLWHELLSTL